MHIILKENLKVGNQYKMQFVFDNSHHVSFESGKQAIVSPVFSSGSIKFTSP